MFSTLTIWERRAFLRCWPWPPQILRRCLLFSRGRVWPWSSKSRPDEEATREGEGLSAVLALAAADPASLPSVLEGQGVALVFEKPSRRRGNPRGGGPFCGAGPGRRRSCVVAFCSRGAGCGPGLRKAVQTKRQPARGRAFLRCWPWPPQILRRCLLFSRGRVWPWSSKSRPDEEATREGEGLSAVLALAAADPASLP